MTEQLHDEKIYPEEGDGLSRGTQMGIAAFFVGLPFLAMGVEALSLGETGLILSALGAGALGLGTKQLIDKHRQAANAHLNLLPEPYRALVERWRNADWGALVRPAGTGEGTAEDAEEDEEAQTDEDEASFTEEDDEDWQPFGDEPFPSSSLLQGRMHLGKHFRPPVNSIFSGRKVLFGASGAGKSNAIAVLAEEIGKRYGAPLFLLDTEDEYRSLCDRRYLARPLWMDKSKLPVEKASEFAQWALAGMRQVIINLQSYEDHEAAWLIIRLIEGARAWEEAHEVRLPCEFILDEAAVWLPQVAGQSTLSKYMISDPDGNTDEHGKIERISLHTLLERRLYSIMVRRGRKRGMGLILASQRPASIDKEAIASASWCFLMRQTQPADFKVYREYDITPKMALSLKEGEVFVFGPGMPMEQYRFRLRYSPDGAKTPGLQELRWHQQQQHASRDRGGSPQQPTAPRAASQPLQEQHPQFPWTQPLAQSTHSGMKDLPCKAEQHSVTEKPAPVVLPERKRKAEDIDLPTAVMIWNAVLPSVREMEETFNLNNHQARKLRDLILRQPHARKPEGEAALDDEEASE